MRIFLNFRDKGVQTRHINIRYGPTRLDKRPNSSVKFRRFQNSVFSVWHCSSFCEDSIKERQQDMESGAVFAGLHPNPTFHHLLLGPARSAVKLLPPLTDKKSLSPHPLPLHTAAAFSVRINPPFLLFMCFCVDLAVSSSCFL